MITNLKKTWTLFKTHKKYLLLTILLELIFLVALIQLQFVFFTPTLEITNTMMEAMSTTVNELAESEVYELETRLQQNPEFITAYHKLLKYLTYFLLTALALWIVIRGVIWHLSLKTVYKKMPITTTWLKFSLLSIFWFILLVTAFVLYSAAQGIMFNTAYTIIMIAAALAIFYFGQISYSLIPAQQTFKNTFVYGVKYARTIIPAFILNIILSGIALSIPFIFIKTIPILSLAIIILITIPGLAFTRLHIIITTWQKH